MVDLMIIIRIFILSHYSSANAFASVIEYSFKRKYQRQIQVSRLFLYYNGRREQYPDRTIQDAGTSVKHMADAIVKFGFCEEKFWPYQIDLVNQKPSHEAYQNAKKFTIVPVQTQATLKNIKTALTKGLPTMIGILLLHTAKAEAAKYGGRISTPTIVATNIMNTQKHAIVCVGYDDQQQYLIVRNSRGERWVRAHEISIVYLFSHDFSRVAMDISIYPMITFHNHISSILGVAHGHYVTLIIVNLI